MRFDSLFNRRYWATSSDPSAVALRNLKRKLESAAVPVPKFVARPVLDLVLGVRAFYYFGVRVVVCEPLFKAYCREVGSNFHTGTFLHWVQGRGDIILGDNVRMDGKISIAFAARYTERPVLRIGSNTGINHLVSFTIGNSITVGSYCRIAGGVAIFDVGGHPADPAARIAGNAPGSDEVKPVRIGDNVWIGQRSIIHPGVTIGDGSIVSAGSVVMSEVPAYSVVAGNPARKIANLTRPSTAQDRTIT